MSEPREQPFHWNFLLNVKQSVQQVSKGLIISKVSLKGSLGSWIEAKLPQKSTPHMVLVYERLFLNFTVFCLFHKLMKIQSLKKTQLLVLLVHKSSLYHKATGFLGAQYRHGHVNTSFYLWFTYCNYLWIWVITFVCLNTH